MKPASKVASSNACRGHAGRNFNPLDIVGRQFFNLTIQAYLHRAEAPGKREAGRSEFAYWYRCVCACGNETVKQRRHILTGHAKSCGCLHHAKADRNLGWKGAGQISGYAWSRVRTRARERGYTLTVTMEQAWDQYVAQDGRCAFTGWAIALGLSSKMPSTQTASLDRIDSTRGYEMGNIQWVHKDLNKMKWNLPDAQFIAICQAVAAYTTRKL